MSQRLQGLKCCRLLAHHLGARTSTSDGDSRSARHQRDSASQDEGHADFKQFLDFYKSFADLEKAAAPEKGRKEDISFNEVMAANLLLGYSRAAFVASRLAKGKTKRGGNSSIVAGMPASVDIAACKCKWQAVFRRATLGKGKVTVQQLSMWYLLSNESSKSYEVDASISCFSWESHRSAKSKKRSRPASIGITKQKSQIPLCRAWAKSHELRGRKDCCSFCAQSCQLPERCLLCKFKQHTGRVEARRRNSSIWWPTEEQRTSCILG